MTKPKQIGPVLLGKNNKDVEMYYKKYKSNRAAANVFGGVGGFLVGYPLGAVIVNKPLDTRMLGVGLGLVAVSLLFQSGSNYNLKQAINHFNGDTGKRSSLLPGVYQDQWGTRIALRVAF